MGDGRILEQGANGKLLHNKDGPYSRLVAAQKLRDNSEVGLRNTDSDISMGESTKEMENRRTNDVSLGHEASSHSLVSEIIGQQDPVPGGGAKGDDYGISYLFLRMGKLNRSKWKYYGFGMVAACRA
jgi:ATP-binding cassette subfamily B (MDR/TAP) protein 1